MKTYKNDEQQTFPPEDCGCEACIGERENQRLSVKILFDQDKLEK
jgi:hypothetical protein